MRKLILGIVLLLGLGQAHAGFLIDPYIGYGYINLTTDVPGDKDDVQGGTFYGSRVGYEWFLFAAGVDLNAGSTEDFNRTNVEAFFQVKLPILFHAYGKYGISSEFDTDLSDEDYDFKDGWALGAATTILPFVSLNIEYQNYDYEADVGSDTYDVETGVWLFAVTLPLEF